MQDLKEFINKLSSDENLAQKVKSAKNIKEVVAIAKKEGYFFSENDLAKVAGGADPTTETGVESEGQQGINLHARDIKASILDLSKVNQKININSSGDNNTQQNTGNISSSR